CVEACVYGTLDFVGYPRFPAPVEFIAAVIAYYVHPVNIQTACLIMEGAEFTEIGRASCRERVPMVVLARLLEDIRDRKLAVDEVADHAQHRSDVDDAAWRAS